MDEPDLAYNRHANRYLVVWQQESGSLWDIYGQQVHGGGGLFQTVIQIVVVYHFFHQTGCGGDSDDSG